MLSRSIRNTSKGIRLARSFITVEAAGVKVNARDDGRPVSQVSLVIKAGSRYDTAPGVAHCLEKFAYKNNNARSALRFVRETELLGGQFSSSISKENIVLTTKFLREDLPYFVTALSDVVKGTVFNKYEFDEDVAPLASFESKTAAKDTLYVALEAAHEVAFRTGLGNYTLAQEYSPVTLDHVKNLAREAYTKANITVVASGVEHGDLVEIVGDKFGKLGSGAALSTPATKFYSGESRVKAVGGSSVVIAFPVKSSPVYQVLANILGGESSIKWSAGQSPLALEGLKSHTSVKASVADYSDASLFYISVDGHDDSAVKASTLNAVKALKALAAQVAEQQVASAVAKSKFTQASLLEAYNPITAFNAKTLDYGSVNAASVKKAVSDLIKSKPVLSVVGKVHELPYLDELF